MAENKKRKPKKKRKSSPVKKQAEVTFSDTSVYKKYDAPKDKSIFLRIFVIILAAVIFLGFVIAPLISI